MNPNDDIQGAVTALSKTLGQPVLLDLQLPAAWEMAEARIPNLYAGQIHYVSARSKSGQAIELTARTPASERVRIQFENQPTTVEAPYLHWCRSRIDRLIAEGDNKQAIALSTESNLACRLTAFIAWDESEKVTVASHHLAQPSMELGSPEFDDLCGQGALYSIMPSMARHAPRAAKSALARSFLMDLPDRVSRSLRETASPASRDFEFELAELCRRIGGVGWNDWLRAIHDWLTNAPDLERSKGVEALCRLIEEIKVLVSQIEAWKRDLARHRQLGTEPVQRPEKRIEEATENVRMRFRKFVDEFVAPTKGRRSGAEDCEHDKGG
jgi:hypothetical protein